MKNTLATALLLSSLAASSTMADDSQETVRLFQTFDDPDVPADLDVCADAPFTANSVLGASAWSVKTRKRTAKVRREFVKRIGTGTACLQLTDFSFPVGSTARIYGNFIFADGEFTFDGTCTLTSNSVPVDRLILAGCTANVIAGPEGFVGGIATSNSVFNPFQLPGVSTGSFWTIRTFSEAINP